MRKFICAGRKYCAETSFEKERGLECTTSATGWYVFM
jgi:hypothetical protein